jgi:phage minor structural protein
VFDRQLKVYSPDFIGYVGAQDGLTNCKASLELNGKSTLKFTLPLASPKWDLFEGNVTVQVDGREYVFLNPNEFERARTLDGTVYMSESWNLLGRAYPTVGSTDYAVIILSGEAGQGGFPAGSAGSALYRLLNGTDWTGRVQWTVGTVDVDGFHDLETEKQTLLENIYEVQKTWGGWLVWDSINHTVSLRDDTLWANDTGFEIRYKKNEKSLKKIEDWEPVVTRLIPFGENDLDISSVNGGVKYLENFTYVSEVREKIHRWDDIADADELKDTATKHLTQYCRPQVQYTGEILDLRTLSDYSHEELALGDIVTIQDESLADSIKVRLIAHTYDVLQPWKCSVKLGDPITDVFSNVVSTTRKVELIYGDTKSTITNFDLRNDRDGSAIVDPVVENDGSAVDHTVNTDSTTNISFEWTWAGNEADIDGWIVYVRQSSSATSYDFGTTPSEETTYYLTADRRAFIMHGVPANMYYTFGVRAYRVVDPDINAGGVIQSNIVQPSLAAEDPYRPSVSVAFTGDVSGTVNGTAGSTITTAVTNFNNRNDRISTTPAVPVVPSNGTAVDHTINPGTGMADISFEWTFSGTGDAYNIDGFLVYIMARTSSAAYTFGTTPKDEQIVTLPKDTTHYILRGVDPTLYYTFGVSAYRVVDPDIASSGIKQSAIGKPSLGAENPYRPASNAAWPGDVTGTVGGLPVDKVAHIVGCGDGSDGALSTTGNVTFSVPLDGEPVVKKYTSLTVNNGHTITTSQRCKGLILLVQGDVVIHAGGKIHMDDKAAYVGSGIPGGASANFLLTMPITSLFAYSLIPVGGAGGRGGKGGDGNVVVASGSGATLKASPGGLGGKGGMNSAFGGSGGGGGGSGQWNNYFVSGYLSGCYPGGGGKGAGNGGLGGSKDISSDPAQSGEPGEFGGGGGILAIIAGGNITISGVVSASGVAPGQNGGNGEVKDGTPTRYGRGGGGGGGSGGGVVVLARYGNYTNNGSVLVNGSDGGAGGGPWQYPGEAGQSGQVGSIIEVKLTS